MTPFAEDELLHLLKDKLKNKNSSGPDEVPFFLIKRTIDVLIKPVTYLINLSFLTGEFPNYLKTGKVVPIYKKLDPHLVENYRPVVVPSGFSKIFEYAYLSRLTPFLNKYDMLTDNQHGFCKNRSTHTAMYAFYEKLVEYIEAGECPVGIFCDLSRAFDCVDHDKLLIKLHSYGIRGVALEWISSFLKNRLHYVTLTYSHKGNVVKVSSEYKEIHMGVPQGSILGPILFLIYTNELDMLTSDAFLVMYADDQSLLLSDKSDATLALKCNDSLNKLNNWYCFYKLYFNTDKTQYIRFHNRQKSCMNLDIKMNNCSLPNSKNVKFLGIMMDDCLNWNSHCETLITKLNSISYLIRSLKSVMSKVQLISLYHAYVDSRLRYGICLWGNSTLSPDVFIVQKRILRAMAGLSSTCSCRNVFKEYKVLTVVSVLIYELCVYVFNHKTKFIKNKNFHDRNTRQNDNFHIPFYKFNVSLNSPNCLGLKVFNHLSLDIKEAKNLNSFKFKLKLYLLEKSFYTLNEFFSAT